jgi:hypothetical protein
LAGQLRHEHELPSKSKAGRKPFTWGVDVAPECHFGLCPDMVFGLEDSPTVFFLEADRGRRR